MAKEIIAQIDIDIEALIKKASEVKKSITEMSQGLAHQKTVQKHAQEQITDYTSALEALRAQGKEYTKEGQAFRNLIEKSNETLQKSTVEIVKQEAQLKKAQNEYRIYNTVLTAKTKSTLNENEAIQITNGSIKELSAALSHNKQVYQQLSKEERENEKIGGKLLKVIEEQSAQYKELQKSIGNTQVEVGNYKEEVKKALSEHFNMSDSLTQFSSSFGGIVNVINASSGSLKAFVAGNKASQNALMGTSTGLKLLRIALVSTGIGAIVVLLGSLIAYLTSTQEGVNRLNSVLTPLKTVFATLYGVVQNLGKAFVDTFKNSVSGVWDVAKAIGQGILLPVNQVIASLKAMGKIAKLDIKGAWEEAKKPISNLIDTAKSGAEKLYDSGKQIAGAFDGVGDKMKEAWQRGQQIAEIEEKLSESEADFIEKTELLRQQFKEQNKIAEDTTKTIAERENATQKSIEIQKQINALAKERNDLEVKRLELQFSSNDTSDADRAELARKKAELNQANAQMEEAVTTQNNKLNTIRKEKAQKARERAEKEIEEQKKVIEHYVATNSAVAQSLQERLQIEEKAMNDRLSVLEKELKIGKITKTEYEREKQNIELEFLRTRAELSVEAVKNELSAYEKANQTKIDKETELTQALINEELLRIQAIYNKKVEAFEQEKALKIQAREWDFQKEAEHQQNLADLKREFEEEYQTQSKDLKTQLQAQELQEKKTNQEIEFQDRLLKLQEQGAMQWEMEAEQLRQKHEQESQTLENQYQNGTIKHDEYLKRLDILNRKHAEDEKQLKQKTEEAKMQMLAGALGQAKSLFAEHTAVGKAVAVAEATINTFLGVTKALSAYPPPINTVMAGVTMATGMKNVQKIMSTNTKYAKGGLIVGKSHAEGGVPFSVNGLGGFEAEGGEYISSREVTARYFPLLEAMKKSVHGNATNPRPQFFRYGDIINSSQSNSYIDIEKIANAVKEGALQGAFEGAKSGSMQGTSQGAFEGTTIGTSSAIYESSLKVNDNNNAKKTAVI